MITAQLGPPMAVGVGGNDGEITGTDSGETSDGGGLFAALFAMSAESAAGLTSPASNPPAAGPLMGELPSEADADVAGLTPPVVAGPLGGASLSVIASSVGVTTEATEETAPTARPPVAPVSGASVAPITDNGTAQPPAPARASATGDGPASSTSDSAGQRPTPTAPAAPAAVPAPDGSLAPERPAPAALVTVALSTRTEGRPAAAAVAASATGESLGAPRADASAPPASPAGIGASTGTTHHPGGPMTAAPTPLAGATNAAELAHELGARMRMAVREGGRELVANLRPAELGHLTVRVAMVDGVLTAHIAAERPEAARLLQQTLPQLDGVLQSLGFSVDSVDVSYAGQQGQAGHDAPGAPSQGKVADGEFSEDTDADSPADGSVTASEPPSRGAAASGGLNLLV